MAACRAFSASPVVPADDSAALSCEVERDVLDYQGRQLRQHFKLAAAQDHGTKRLAQLALVLAAGDLPPIDGVAVAREAVLELALRERLLAKCVRPKSPVMLP
jgi:hypothetical protein